MMIKILTNTTTPKLYFIIWFLSLIVFAKVSQQDSFVSILFPAFFSIVAYIGILMNIKAITPFRCFAWGLAGRLIFCFVMPMLSDDIYRYIWDGRLHHEGLEVFANTPAQWVGSNFFKINEPLYYLLNSPTYHSVYPSIHQWIFWLCTLVPSHDFMVENFMFKIIFIFADLGIWLLLKEFAQKTIINDRTISLYWLNPLIIIELIGNLHFELIMMLGIVILLYGLMTNKGVWIISGLFLSIATKIYPLMFLPLLLAFRPNWKFFFHYLVGTLLVLVAFSFTIPISYWLNFLSSIRLYFSCFEFNASIYTILSNGLEFGYFGYNPIAIVGPLLSMVTVSYCIYLSLNIYQHRGQANIKYLAQKMLSLQLCYLLLSTTIHPWYIVGLMITALIAHNQFIIILWGFLSILSYSHYDSKYEAYHNGLIIIEYTILLLTLLYFNLYHTLPKLKQNIETIT